LKTKLYCFFILFFTHYVLLAQITPAQNIVCQNETTSYSSTTNYDTYKWRVVGGTPTTSTSSTINVTWGYGNRGAISVEGFNSGVSQGVVTKKIYIDQKAIFSASPNLSVLMELRTM
jgi:hypothetical protein